MLISSINNSLACQDISYALILYLSIKENVKWNRGVLYIIIRIRNLILNTSIKFHDFHSYEN